MGVCVYGCGMLICFVSALGSHEIGRNKLPIISSITDGSNYLGFDSRSRQDEEPFFIIFSKRERERNSTT